MPMGEIKLNEILARNPKLINCLNRYTSHPMIRKNSHIPHPHELYQGNI